MESRTTTFEASPVKDFQTELENDSPFHFSEQQDFKGAITVLCTPKKEGVACKVSYSTVVHPQRSDIDLHTVFTSLTSGGQMVITKDNFSFKSSVKMQDIQPWIAQLRDKHAGLCRQNAIDESIGKVAVGRALKLVWERMREGFVLQHEKKSKSKDKKDKDSEELF